MGSIGIIGFNIFGNSCIFRTVRRSGRMWAKNILRGINRRSCRARQRLYLYFTLQGNWDELWFEFNRSDRLIAKLEA